MSEMIECKVQGPFEIGRDRDIADNRQCTETSSGNLPGNILDGLAVLIECNDVSAGTRKDPTFPRRILIRLLSRVLFFRLA
jgi:hypothetical protein